MVTFIPSREYFTPAHEISQAVGGCGRLWGRSQGKFKHLKADSRGQAGPKHKVHYALQRFFTINILRKKSFSVRKKEKHILKFL